MTAMPCMESPAAPNSLHTCHVAPRGSVWSYVVVHGTDQDCLRLRGIMLHRFARPSSEDLSESNMSEITQVALYGAATPGNWSTYTIQVVLDNLLRKPKGVQGYTAIGTIDSRSQHYRIEFRNTIKEHEVVFARGVVRSVGHGMSAIFTFEHRSCPIIIGYIW